MKRIASMLAGLSLAVLLFAGSAHAQYGGQRIVANIPFEFTVGHLSFPAGHYDFLRTGANIVAIRDARGLCLFTGITAPIQPNGRPERTVLRFATVNGRHLLIEIWSDRTATGDEFQYRHLPRT